MRLICSAGGGSAGPSSAQRRMTRAAARAAAKGTEEALEQPGAADAAGTATPATAGQRPGLNITIPCLYQWGNARLQFLLPCTKFCTMLE